MIQILQDRFSMYSNFELINDDVLKVDLKSLIKENKKELFSKKQHGLEAQLTIHAVF